MLQALEPGCRVKLRGLSKVGGVTYNGKLATVQASVGNRFSIKMDAVDRDGTVRKGQGLEIRVAPENMEIFDEELEAMLDAEEAAGEFDRASPQASFVNTATLDQGKGKGKSKSPQRALGGAISAVLQEEEDDLTRKMSDPQELREEGGEGGIEVGHMPFAMLDGDTDEAMLREFHATEGLKVGA